MERRAVMVGKKWFGILWGIVLIFVLSFPSESFAAVSVSKDIKNTASYFKSSALNSDFAVAALAKENLLTANEIKQYRKVLTDRVNAKKVTGTELVKTIIALKAIGEDPENFQKQNLIKRVYDTAAESSVTGYAYDLIALNTDDYEIPSDAPNTPAKIAAKLVDAELPDGGWSWSSSAKNSDVDSTGMVLTALGTYQDKHDKDVNQAIRDGIKYLKAAEKENASFDNYGINSCTTAQAIIGLVSVGVNPSTGDFVKKGTNPVSALSTYKDSKNGGYKWQTTSESSDSFSTEQVFQALVAYDLFLKGDTLYNFRNISRSDAGSTGATDSDAEDKDPGKSPGHSPAAAPPRVVEKHTKEVVTKTNTITNTKDHTITHNNTTTKTNTVEKPAAAKKQTPAKTKTASNAKKEDKPATAAAQAPPAEDAQQEPKKVVITKTTGVSPVHGWVGSLSAGAGVILLIIRKKFLGV
ncbi:terpene cyclase [Heyndrickxia coagulans]|uniref:terpene cyclase n=1 Tax=Heyndrickxia coagulans TaxID=1398 RepID=UPI0028F8E33F|nr:terpene cyclase [Heyndrickxia coagulans]MDT9757063.1 terpene cyclase [Heyndrickxia coagulans]